MAIPDKAITRGEQYLAAMAGQSGTLPDTPITRKERYLAKAAGQDVETPPPITREEKYLDVIAEGGGGGGGDISVVPLLATENKKYTAPVGKAYSPVTVNVPGPSGTKQISISANGTTTENVSAYASAEIAVNVPIPTPVLTAKTVTQNGTYAAAAEGADGYSSVTVDVTGGGGGAVLIASGTFTGNGSPNIDIPVGKKMPQTNFIFNCWVDDGTTIAPTASTDRVVVTLQHLVQKRFCGFDLSTDGTKTIVSKLTYPTVGEDGTTVTDRTPDESCRCAGYVRMTAVAIETQGITSIARASTGFTIKLSKNSQYLFANGITYNWEVLYIGSDAANDIVEVA